VDIALDKPGTPLTYQRNLYFWTPHYNGYKTHIVWYKPGDNCFYFYNPYTDTVWGRCPLNSAWFQELPVTSQVKAGGVKQGSIDLIDKAAIAFRGVKKGRFPSMVGHGPKETDNAVDIPAAAQSRYRLIGPPDDRLP
jgi:hypothetical protein